MFMKPAKGKSCGNIVGVALAKIAAAIDKSDGEPAPRYHKIVRGDRMQKLDKFYGLPLGSFESANPDKDPRRLRLGDKLRLPQLKQPTARELAAPAIPEPAIPFDPVAVGPNPDDHKMRKFYNAIIEAETGSEKDRWIRTRGVPGSSSSAWGPAQLTKTKLADYMKRYPKRMGAHKKFYESTLLPMYNNFLKYGREPKKAGYDKRWDYGGYGIRLTPQQQAQYANMVMDMMAIDRSIVDDKYPKASEAFRRNKSIQMWRGTANDPRYFKIVNGFYE